MRLQSSRAAETNSVELTLSSSGKTGAVAGKQGHSWTVRASGLAQPGITVLGRSKRRRPKRHCPLRVRGRTSLLKRATVRLLLMERNWTADCISAVAESTACL